jgi:hypothetical protein
MRHSTLSRALWYLALLATLTLVGVLYTLNWSHGDALQQYGLGKGWEWNKHNGSGAAKEDHGVAELAETSKLSEGVHPIAHLMKIAAGEFDQLLQGEAHTLEGAALHYETRRGRLPPPGFDAWYAYAVESGAVIVEDFWDQIYEDLAPFWSLEPALLKKQAHIFSSRISIRGDKLEAKSHAEKPKLKMWEDMFKTLASHPHVHLPDVDIPLNVHDEPAMLVLWETIDDTISMAHNIKLDPEDVISEYSGLHDVETLSAGVEFNPEWLGPRLRHPESHHGPRPLWSLVRPACPPNSPAQKVDVFNDIWDREGETSEEHSPAGLLPLSLTEGTLQGFVQNWTRTTDACQWPSLQGLHGAFVAPKDISVTMKLFPLFGDSKLAMSNEILLPGAMEWNTSSSATESTSTSWDERHNQLFWRGTATQGREPERYWQRFHRERMVSMLNATQLEVAEASLQPGNENPIGIGYAKNFRLLVNEYHLKSQSVQLAEWVNSWADVAFTDLMCDEETGCPYLEKYFSTTEPFIADEVAKYKYAIAIDSDGGDDAGDFIRQLNQGKATLRASVYRKWYDSRLIPWLHFIPMDNTFVDLYGIMKYFLGDKVSGEANDFPHVQDQVNKYGHNLDTSESEVAKQQQDVEHKNFEPIDQPERRATARSIPLESHDSSSQSGNEPYIPSMSTSNRKNDPHDAAARQIAEAGRSWAGKVLRREDMLIYVYRLLLEYARVVDDKRESLGWVDDTIDE